MTELNFLWEFTSEWASEILESSKLKYTEQSSCWAVTTVSQEHQSEQNGN